jgi:HSP20 family molecular chaperone IbpA
MAEKKKPEEKSEGMAEGMLRELGLGNLVDLALKSPAFQQRFKEVNEQIEKNVRGGTHRGLRPHVESSYSVRHIIEGEKLRPTRKEPIKKIAPREPKRTEPPVDVFDEGDYLRVVAELPGVEEHDIKAEAKGTALTISAERGNRKYSERVELPAPVTGELTTRYKHGVLELRLEKINKI